MGCQGGPRGGAWDTARAIVAQDGDGSGDEPLGQGLKSAGRGADGLWEGAY